MVATPISSASAIWRSVQAGPELEESALSRTRAWASSPLTSSDHREQLFSLLFGQSHHVFFHRTAFGSDLLPGVGLRNQPSELKWCSTRSLTAALTFVGRVGHASINAARSGSSVFKVTRRATRPDWLRQEVLKVLISQSG